jgi:hypothetical protein
MDDWILADRLLCYWFQSQHGLLFKLILAASIFTVEACDIHIFLYVCGFIIGRVETCSCFGIMRIVERKNCVTGLSKGRGVQQNTILSAHPSKLNGTMPDEHCPGTFRAGKCPGLATNLKFIDPLWHLPTSSSLFFMIFFLSLLQKCHRVLSIIMNDHCTSRYSIVVPVLFKLLADLSRAFKSAEIPCRFKLCVELPVSLARAVCCGSNSRAEDEEGLEPNVMLLELNTLPFRTEQTIGFNFQVRVLWSCTDLLQNT